MHLKRDLSQGNTNTPSEKLTRDGVFLCRPDSSALPLESLQSCREYRRFRFCRYTAGLLENWLLEQILRKSPSPPAAHYVFLAQLPSLDPLPMIKSASRIVERR